MKKFVREFKEFISRGNIVDLSVAVIIGGAFSAIVTALTDKIIMPLVNWILAICGGSQGLESAYTILSGVKDADGNWDLSKSIYINWGAFISAIINFLIIAFTVFLIIKIINESKKRIEKFNSDLKKEPSKEVIEKELSDKQLTYIWRKKSALSLFSLIMAWQIDAGPIQFVTTTNYCDFMQKTM